MALVGATVPADAEKVTGVASPTVGGRAETVAVPPQPTLAGVTDIQFELGVQVTVA